jgi:hypothetical protein
MLLNLKTLLLSSIIFGVSSFASLETTWQEGVDALTANNSVSAREKFQSWIEEARKEGIRSPEAHRNFALALWQQNEKGQAVEELLKSTQLRNWPWQLWSDFEALSQMQRELGIANNVAEMWNVRLAAMATSNNILLLTLFSVWSLCSFAWLREKKGLAPLGMSSLVAGVIFTLMLTALLANKRLTGMLALCQGGDPTPFYRSAFASDQEAILELPPGSLLLVDKISEKRMNVSLPVPSWVPADKIHIFGI